MYKMHSSSQAVWTRRAVLITVSVALTPAYALCGMPAYTAALTGTNLYCLVAETPSVL